MLDRPAKTFFHLLARSGTLDKLASRYGMRRPESFARRFIAGESVQEAIEAARAIEARHMRLTLDLLGESVTNLEEADAATRQIVRSISLLSVLGLVGAGSAYAQQTVGTCSVLPANNIWNTPG